MGLYQRCGEGDFRLGTSIISARAYNDISLIENLKVFLNSLHHGTMFVTFYFHWLVKGRVGVEVRIPGERRSEC